MNRENMLGLCAQEAPHQQYLAEYTAIASKLLTENPLMNEVSSDNAPLDLAALRFLCAVTQTTDSVFYGIAKSYLMAGRIHRHSTVDTIKTLIGYAETRRRRKLS